MNNEAKWQLVKSDYIAGNGSMRALAARHGERVHADEKGARRERWTANRTLASHSADAAVVTTMQERAQGFVNRSAEQTDRFLTRVSESEAILEPEDKVALVRSSELSRIS